MWSLFPQTSSGNLNNSLYLPPAASRRMAARAPGWELNPPSGVQRTQRVAGSAESRLAFPGTRRTQRPGERRGAREAGTGKGDGSREAARGLAPAGQQAGLGSASRTPASPVRGPPLPPAPDPRLPAPPQQRALAGARGAPRYLGSDPAGRSPRRCHSALRETDTQLQLGFARRPAAATLARASAPNRSPSPGPGGGKGQGSRAPRGGE